jgi:hypothetical protein
MPAARRRIAGAVGPGRFRRDRRVGRESAVIGREQRENPRARGRRQFMGGDRADDLVTLVAEGEPDPG